MKMRLVVYILILICIVPFQATFGSKMDIFGVKPDIGLVIVYLIGFLYGEMDGLIMGILIGFVMDSFASNHFGINLFTKSLTGFIAGYLGKVLLNPLINPGIIMVLSLFCGILTLLILQMTTGRIVVLDAITMVIIPQAIYDTLIGFLICIAFNDKIEMERFKGIAR